MKTWAGDHLPKLPQNQKPSLGETLQTLLLLQNKRTIIQLLLQQDGAIQRRRSRKPREEAGETSERVTRKPNHKPLEDGVMMTLLERIRLEEAGELPASGIVSELLASVAEIQQEGDEAVVVVVVVKGASIVGRKAICQENVHSLKRREVVEPAAAVVVEEVVKGASIAVRKVTCQENVHSPKRREEAVVVEEAENVTIAEKTATCQENAHSQKKKEEAVEVAAVEVVEVVAKGASIAVKKVICLEIVHSQKKREVVEVVVVEAGLEEIISALIADRKATESRTARSH